MMSNVSQILKAVEVLRELGPMANSPIFSAAQVSELLAEKAASGLVPGALHCAKCGIHATLVGKAYQQARDEGCPCGCGPLWPLTWEQHADKLQARVIALESLLIANQIPLSQLNENKMPKGEKP